MNRVNTGQYFNSSSCFLLCGVRNSTAAGKCNVNKKSQGSYALGLGIGGLGKKRRGFEAADSDKGVVGGTGVSAVGVCGVGARSERTVISSTICTADGDTETIVSVGKTF